jgi:hypothetical protein
MGLESRQNPWPIITPPDVGGKEYLTLLWVFSNIGYKAESLPEVMIFVNPNYNV